MDAAEVTDEELAERARMALAEAGYPDWLVFVQREGDRRLIRSMVGLPKEVRWRMSETAYSGVRPPRCFACFDGRYPPAWTMNSRLPPEPPDRCESFGRMFLADCGVPRGVASS